ncbi:MAG: polyprenyl synthetase family protein [Firmicutes bacterium]|nr:polyprenyl synthetase family protein [Bacillota bacterium]
MEMGAVERALGEALAPLPGSPQKLLRELLENRGKMLRPRLLVLCAVLTGGERIKENEVLYRTAAAVEMIHTASLVHDDIIDNASCRRGRPTLHLLRGRKAAILAGDLLLARAFALLSEKGHEAGPLRLMARSVALLCRGELCQAERRHRWDLSERQYYRIIHLKTAQFIASCCEAGGWIAGATAGERRSLRQYGLNLGQAFQLVDDLADYSEAPLQGGKPAGSDLKQGLATLPLIHLLETRPRYRQMLRAASPELPPALLELLRRVVGENGSLDYTLAAARCSKEQALRALQPFPDGAARQALAGAAAAVTGPVPARPDPEAAPPG